MSEKRYFVKISVADILIDTTYILTNMNDFFDGYYRYV